MNMTFVFKAYLKSRIKVIAAFVLMMLVYALVYALYYLPLEPIVYSAELVTALAVVFASIDFWRFYQKHQRLNAAISGATAGVGELPKPRDLLEENYQTLIRVLAESRAELISQFDNRQTDMIDYYTLWAHQIKTPISAMGVLLQTEEGDRERISAYRQELFKIEQYVEMVLQYLRLESMSADLLLVEYNLGDLVRQAVKKYGIIFINKKISLELAELDCRVLTDEKWLVFVLEQIISNALKYTNQGKISIYLDHQAEKTLIIEDTGVGIRAEDIARIFDRGFTGYNGRMDKKSTGIGLYLCQQVLNKLSHSITVASQVGQGTRVSIDLATRGFEAL
ncbi:sensor histidine kinase [Acetobacterium wieringae]|uniref:histidine kinase n=1 Tax=Acetobacterium wieringae TaxID=52694 RepID=A0ABY6HID9_9FIRM|nr:MULTISPECIES: sensor histidine kinase [Acetobacterium]MEA4804612.1 sensor histidine kinase [Acetobacterium wieringae]UYO63346.1 sensor histidine kinase [Acetobacterium wieringae]VUZ24046.1 Sensor histidine kinase GraS [Acetobacterium wieringae]